MKLLFVLLFICILGLGAVSQSPETFGLKPDPFNFKKINDYLKKTLALTTVSEVNTVMQRLKIISNALYADLMMGYQLPGDFAGYCRKLGSGYDAEIVKEIENPLSKSLAGKIHQDSKKDDPAIDPWGQLFVLIVDYEHSQFTVMSSGPDALADTSDDIMVKHGM